MVVLRESPWYQEILQEELTQGIEQGIEQGSKQEAIAHLNQTLPSQ